MNPKSPRPAAATGSEDSAGLVRRLVGALTSSDAAEDARALAAAVFESVAGMVITDTDAVILKVNRAFSQMTGYPAEELVGKKISLLKSGRHDAEFYHGMWQALGQTGIWQGEIWDRKKNGEVYPKLLAISAVKDASGTVTRYVGAQYNRSAIWQAEIERLTAAAAFDSMQAALIVDEHGTILQANRAFTELTGYSSAEAIGRRASLLRIADSDRQGFSQMMELVRARQPGKVIMSNYRKDGSRFWNELSLAPVDNVAGEPGLSICLMNDISAQKEADKQLVAWSLRLDALTTMSEEGLVTFDDNGILSYVNMAFLNLTGLGEAALRGTTLASFEELFAGQCDPGQPYRKVTTDLIGPETSSAESAADEEEIHLVLPKKRILLRKFRKVTHGTSLLLYYRDVTKERNLEDMKSEFLATAAHELRTPMASIYGYAELLLLRAFKPARRRELLEIIVRHSRRVTDLLNELLDLARIEARRGKDFVSADHDLRSILDGVGPTFGEAAQRVVIAMSDESILVRADREKLHQALINLVGNALKFSPAEESVNISVQRTAGEVTPRVCIAIQDRGIGMTPHQLERFGDRFFRADPSGVIPGTGLGVSLAKDIISIHGGTVTISSEFGKGSSVKVWLPIEGPTGAAERQTPGHTEPA